MLKVLCVKGNLMNIKATLCILVIAVSNMTGCASKEYNQNISNIISDALERSKNPISSIHIRCFKCETYNWPDTVAELKLFSPTTQECQDAFKITSLNEVDHIKNADISVKETESKVSILFAKPGVTFENMTMKDNFVTKNFTISELSCSHNK
jgi:hypothetical protein